MANPESLLYAGYGANRDPAMIAAITGTIPRIIGAVAIHDVELCVQRLDQTPDEVLEDSPADISVRQIMLGSWGGNSGFETYTIRAREGARVNATLFELTQAERDLIAEWEMIEYGWYERMQVQVELSTGDIVSAETEGLRAGQETDRLVNGKDYVTYLNDADEMHATAEAVRAAYLENAQG